MINIIEGTFEAGFIYAFLALGTYFSFRVLQMADLTIEGSFPMGGAICAILISQGVNAFLALLIAFLAGALAGAVTGLLHTKGKIPIILAGIITMTGLYSINLRIAKGVPNMTIDTSKTIFAPMTNLLDSLFPKGTALWSYNGSLGIILTVMILLLLVTLVIYYFFGTETGLAIRATGMNQDMARAENIHTDFSVILGLAISNALVSLSGGLLAMKQSNYDINSGKGTIVIGLAAIIIGEAVFVRKKTKNHFKNALIAIILGAVVYEAIITIAIAVGINPNDLRLLQAIFVALVLVAPVIKRAVLTHRARKGGKDA